MSSKQQTPLAAGLPPQQQPVPTTAATNQAPANLVGRRPTLQEFDGRYIIRAAIEKIVNVPNSLKTPGLSDKLQFRINLAVNTSADGLKTTSCSAPPINLVVNPGQITKASGSGQNEIIINPKPNDGESTWHVQASEGRNQLVGKCSMKLTLYEQFGGNVRVLYDMNTPQIALQKVYDRKVLVFLYGSPIGRIGVSLSVSPSDNSGFTSRLDRFLSQFPNAKSDPSVASEILKKCDEITTFAFMWKRFRVVDYHARLKRYFKLYARGMEGKEQQLLSEYSMNEEILFKNLVLDNGPEELEVDQRKRLEAYKTKYRLQNLDAEKEAQRKPVDFIDFVDSLVSKNGPEPDPRTYLFPEPFYQPPGGASVNTQSDQNNQNNNSVDDRAISSSNNAAAAAASASPQNNANMNAPSSSPQPRSLGNVNSNNMNANAASPPNNTSSQQQQQQQQQSQSNFGSSSPSSMSMSASIAPPGGDLWGSFINSLIPKRVSSSDIYFLSDDAFQNLMGQVNVNPNHRHLVLAEWRRRSAENLQLTHFAPTDPSFDAVRTEVLALTGMQPINLSVLGVVGLRNIEHETSHSARLALMDNKAVDHCVLTGEYNTLLKCSERGITAIMSASDSGLCFPRRPFAGLEKPTAISVMICDVIVGYQTNASTVKEAGLAKSDTVAIGSAATSSDAQLFVRDVRHVLPRFIVHTHVDPTLVPCPLHPNKQVEYFVVDSQTFACSNCVVLGPHIGKPIVTLDEALQWARTQLNDLLRDAESIHSSATEMDNDMTEHLQGITGDAAQKKKHELVESIRREAEMRAQEAAKQLEAEMAMQADILQSQQTRLAPVRTSLQQTSRLLQNASRQGNAARALEVLQSMSATYDGNEFRSRINDVKGNLTSMPSLTSAAGVISRAPWYVASQGSIGVNNPNNNPNSMMMNQSQQQQQQFPASFYPQGYQHPSSSSMSQPRHGGGGGGGNSRSGSESSNPAYSRFMEAASVVAATRQNSTSGGNQSGTVTPVTASLLGGNAHSSHSNNPEQQQLYNKFVAAKSGGGGNSSQAPSPSLPRGGSGDQQNTTNQSVASSTVTQGGGGRELLQDGWKAFRRGDPASARSHWLSASERYANTAIGARAQAYIAEAIDKDAARAAEWYEKALMSDPTDCMTLFNYGVLLEATGHTFRALQLFESASRLGDVASGKRARAIRQQQLASSDN